MVDTQFETLAEVERKHIVAVWEASGGNMSRASRTLGIDRRTLYRKMALFGLRPPMDCDRAGMVRLRARVQELEAKLAEQAGR